MPGGTAQARSPAHLQVSGARRADQVKQGEQTETPVSSIRKLRYLSGRPFYGFAGLSCSNGNFPGMLYLLHRDFGLDVAHSLYAP